MQSSLVWSNAMIEKGLVDKKDLVLNSMKYPKWNRVNSIAWAKNFMQDETCQELFDTKAFTGKGVAYTLRQLVSEVDTCAEEMGSLSAATKLVAGAHMYLAEHRRTEDGYLALRWRGVGTRKHLSWDDAEDYFTKLPSSERDWYRQVNQRAIALNQYHLKLRKMLKDIKIQSQKRKTHIFAKTIYKKDSSFD